MSVTHPKNSWCGIYTRHVIMLAPPEEIRHTKLKTKLVITSSALCSDTRKLRHPVTVTGNA